MEAGMGVTAGEAAEHLAWTLGEEVVTVGLDLLTLTELGVVTAGPITGLDTGTLDSVKTTAPGNILVRFKGICA